MQVFKLGDRANAAVSHDPLLHKQVLFGSGVHPAMPQWATVELPVGAETTPHSHSDMDEFFYVLAGAVVICCDEETVTCMADDAFMIEAGESHVFKNTGSAVARLLYFGLVHQPT